MKKIFCLITLILISGLALAEKSPILSQDVYQPTNESYSAAIKSGQTVYISGQIPVDRQTGNLIAGSFNDQVRQVFSNIKSLAQAAGGSMDSIVRMNIYLTDLGNFSIVNDLIKEFLHKPFPALSVIEVRSLPKGALIEADAIMDVSHEISSVINYNVLSSSGHSCLPKVRGQCTPICRKDGYRSGYCKGHPQAAGVCICS